ncbi:Fbox domain containing protein [Acanthamoeba castellanii str. Neff]|uniref:Fbox domain containing protein n=1 Tax=Acanthamoeba castellanii (strain ATCC 30010 / Neff) TaxID=1257118 RepID=L8GL51_ACACF|nr:Fbox domain containing protein [Acanthamoeba castellanii str. Neff]ELR12926.1 Fbox domain containing protein [Acanthamoeba castellanii str. Neff]
MNKEMEVLPPETWLEVFSLLDARDLQAVQLTCWTFRQLGADDGLWRRLCASECGHQQHLATLRRCLKPGDAAMSYAALYRRLHHSPYLRWDPAQPLDVSNEGLTARQPTEGWTTTSTLQPLKPGRVNYFEITFTIDGAETTLEAGRGYGSGDTIGVYVDLRQGAGLITWLVNGVQVVGMLGLGSLAVAELLPVVSWGGTRYCINLGVVPALPAVDSPAYALQLPREDKTEMNQE